jgi:uncharacterized protein (DUF1778 family)
MNEEMNNIEAAMSKAAETIAPTKPFNASSTDGETASKQVLLRATETDHERWKTAAAMLDITLSEFIRTNCNKAAEQLLDCTHPPEFLKTYPWSQICLKCGKRLR